MVLVYPRSVSRHSIVSLIGIVHMAREPEDLLRIYDRWGPHEVFAEPHSRDCTQTPSKLVDTHCCFCGQQCGIRLKVKSDRIIGFEPRYDSPFNEGMLCTKGVTRYLQNGHLDRLTASLETDETSLGFRPIEYQTAIDRVANEIKRVQETYGHSAMAVLCGGSLTTEKSYLAGKFARVCLKTPYIDGAGSLGMASAASANKMAFGIDRAANPWDDIVGADVVWISGANVAECSPITTNYIWQAREMGARIVVVDPRITPIARTADVFLPIRPGRDAALFNGVLKIMIDQGWIDHDFIDNYTSGFEQLAEHVMQWPAHRTAKICGVSERKLIEAAELWGQAGTSFLLHSRGIEHHSNGVESCLGAINLVLASGRIGREYCGYATITGQANGQGCREHGQQFDQLPGARDIRNETHRQHVAAAWNVNVTELPGPGVNCYEVIRKIHAGEIKLLLTLGFNPKVSLPNSRFVGEAFDKLEFMASIDVFLTETALHADIVLPGSMQEEDEGVVTQVEGRVIKINRVINPPGDAKQDWRIIQDIARCLGRERGFTFNRPREIFNELRTASKGGISDYSGITYEKIDAQQGVCWPCPTDEHLGTPRLFERNSTNPVSNGTGPFYFPDGKARFCISEFRPPAEATDKRYPIILTTGRVASQFQSGAHTRRIGPLVAQYPEPKIEIHPLLAEKNGVRDGTWTTVETHRGSITLRAHVVKTIRPDTVFIPFHWPGDRSVNRLTTSAQDRVSRIPDFKACACRVFPANESGRMDDVSRAT